MMLRLLITQAVSLVLLLRVFSIGKRSDEDAIPKSELYRADVVSAEIQVPVSQPEEEGQET